MALDYGEQHFLEARFGGRGSLPRQNMATPPKNITQ